MLGKSLKVLIALSLIIIIPLLVSPLSYAGADNKENRPSESGSKNKQSGLIIRNNEIKDSPIGIYIANRHHKLFIESNVVSNNGEAIRWIRSQDGGQIINNRILNNIVGIKFQDTYSHNRKGIIRFPDMALNNILIQGNRIFDNPEGNLINTTGKNPTLYENYWQEDPPEKEPSNGNLENRSKEDKEKGNEQEEKGGEEEAGKGGSFNNTRQVNPENKVEDASKTGKESDTTAGDKNNQLKDNKVNESSNTVDPIESEKTSSQTQRKALGNNHMLFTGGGIVGILTLFFLLT